MCIFNFDNFFQLSCCGVTQYDDWFNITAWPEKSSVPHSCCISSFHHIAGKLNSLELDSSPFTAHYYINYGSYKMLSLFQSVESLERFLCGFPQAVTIKYKNGLKSVFILLVSLDLSLLSYRLNTIMYIYFRKCCNFLKIFQFQLFGLTSSMIIFCAVRHRAGFKTYKAQKSPGLL